MLRVPELLFAVGFIFSLGFPVGFRGAEQRDAVSYLRGPYNIEFYKRHNEAFDISSAIHFAHGKQHDILQLTAGSDNLRQDDKFDSEAVDMLFNPPKTEPVMEYWAPYTARTMWQLYRAIDWTHMHHEQTYDIMSEADIRWNRKKEWTDRAVRYYLNKHNLPRSSAPLDITMRRAGVMMKPYFTRFRNYYPRSNDFFYAAHWWHPAIYEAMMLGGNGKRQESMVRETDAAFFSHVLKDRPKRMLLSREIMPRYSRLSPESANIFDNLHMLHGIAYDILAYKGWTVREKKSELYRVIRAMSHQPGDEMFSRKFNLSHPGVDPRIYEEWMKGTEGDMSRIMTEMMEDMLPVMMPGGLDPVMKEKMMYQFRMKLEPGIQEGEFPGSLAEALKQIMPDMKIMHDSMDPGATPAAMIELMMNGWQARYGNMPDVEPVLMEAEPGKGEDR